MQSFLRNIVEFIDVLRAAGLRISNSESIDAVKALEHIDLLKKEEVRTALSVCLIKRAEDRRIFSEAFDRFFIFADQRMEYIQSSIAKAEQKKQEVEEKALELKFRDKSLSIDPSLKEVYAALPEKEKQGLLDFLDKTSSGRNVKEDFRPIIEAMVRSKLKSMKERYGNQTGSVAGVTVDETAEAGIMAGDILETVRKDNELVYKNLKDIKDQDVLNMIRVIKSMTDKMVKNMVRRKQMAARRSSLDFSRTISKSLTTGGVPFRLKYKRKSKSGSKYLILCDVSASMHRFSGFVLQFLSGMQKACIRSDCYIFSQEAEHINLNGFTNSLAFERQITGSPIWRRGTDMSRALWHIINESDTVLNSSVIFIIVSDAKTVNAVKAAEYLNRIARTVKKIIWLNPVPEDEWTDNQFIGQYRNAAIMFDCSTLNKLQRCMDKIAAGWISA